MCVSLGKKEKKIFFQLHLKKHFPAAQRGGGDSREQRADSVSSGRRYLRGGSQERYPLDTLHHHQQQLTVWPSELPPEIVARDCLSPPVSDHTVATPLGVVRRRRDQRHPSRYEINKMGRFFSCSLASQGFLSSCLFEFLLTCWRFHKG